MIPCLYEPFKHWAANGSVYIISDLHFEDKDCKLMDPNWVSPMEQVQIINDMVMPNDCLICLGDVGNPEYISQIRAKQKILILGNHDKKHVCAPYFNEVYDGALFIADKILLSHEPVNGLPWCLNIHGHDHSRVEKFNEGCEHINVAVNVHGYRPINLGNLIKGGALSDIKNIHRITIDRQVEAKKKAIDNGWLIEEASRRYRKDYINNIFSSHLPSNYNLKEWEENLKRNYYGSVPFAKELEETNSICERANEILEDKNAYKEFFDNF